MARLDDEALLDVGGSLEFSIRPGRSRSDLEIQRISNLVEEENADMDVARPGKPYCPLYTEGNLRYFRIERRACQAPCRNFLKIRLDISKLLRLHAPGLDETHKFALSFSSI